MSRQPAKRMKIVPRIVPNTPVVENPEMIIPDIEHDENSITENFNLTTVKQEIKSEGEHSEPFEAASSIRIKEEPVDYEEMEAKHDYADNSAGTSMDIGQDFSSQVNVNIKMEPGDLEQVNELVPNYIIKTETKKDTSTDMQDPAFETRDFNCQVDFGPDTEVKEIQTMPITFESFSCQVDFPE